MYLYEEKTCDYKVSPRTTQNPNGNSGLTKELGGYVHQLKSTREYVDNLPVISHELVIYSFCRSFFIALLILH